MKSDDAPPFLQPTAYSSGYFLCYLRVATFAILVQIIEKRDHKLFSMKEIIMKLSNR